MQIMNAEKKADEEIRQCRRDCYACFGTLFGCLLCLGISGTIYFLFVMLFAFIFSACEKADELKNCQSYIWASPAMFIGGIVVCAYFYILSCSIYRNCLVRKYAVRYSNEGESDNENKKKNKSENVKEEGEAV